MINFPDDDEDAPLDPLISRPLPEVVAELFGDETPLREAHRFGGRPYEERAQQREMAVAVAESLAAGEHLCVEAPTGIGKSFAYLIPAIVYAKQTGRPVVITTHTIALQEQLLLKDIPLLQQVLGIPFSGALAKGRENYVCLHRLENTLRDHQEYLPVEELKPEVQRIADWASKTTDGTRSSLPFLPAAQTWSAVCSEPGVCPRESGQEDDTCFLARARRRLHKADIIVANHALFCVDLVMRRTSENGQSLLPPYGAVIVDEAHTFEEVAATHLGMRVTSYGVNMVMDRLYRPKSKRGLLAKAEGAEWRELAVRVRGITERFFTRLLQWVEDQEENPLSYFTPGHIPNQVNDSWGELLDGLRQLVKTSGLDDSYRQEVKNAMQRLSDYRETLDVFLEMRHPDYVYWFETYGRSTRYLSLNAVPVEVNTILRSEVFQQDFPVVMTSATLAIRQELRYFRERLGADDARELLLDSPFDFHEQVELHVPFKSMPSPKDPGFLEAACEQIEEFIIKTGGKAFVLFTSYRQMNEAADELESFFQANKLTLLVQGREHNRTQMLEMFRQDITSVIFGTDSFWMGVDVPGEALSNVIIVKLPFPVPTHPVVAARRERIEERGGNAFFEYFLPEAVLKFRQGIGRLIRSRDDHGIIVVLDSRIVRSSYGDTFLESIPDCQRFIF